MNKTSRTAGGPTYIALLRGINVGGHKIVKMEKLRNALMMLGFEDVKTYIQSGNVVFKAPSRELENLSTRIEETVLREFGFPVPVIVRTAEELGEVLKENQFCREKGVDASKLYVTFLSRLPERTAVKMLDAIPVAPDRFCCSGREIYLHCPNGLGGTKLSFDAFEKVLSVGATTRNWNTVTRLYEMSSG
jgi:uncharacterized protein (DUF1697 family)